MKKYIKLFGILVGAPLLVLSAMILPNSASAVLVGPEIISPANGTIMTSAAFTSVDWGNATGGTGPYEYQYASFSDAAYTANLYTSGWMTASDISTVGTPEGDYYLRVRARDATLAETAWSNGDSDVYKVTIDNTPENVAPVLDVITSPVTIPELAAFSFDANATDSNFGDTLTFSLVGGPAGATINSSTGVFMWTPMEVQGAGDYTFTVKISDGALEDTQSVTIHVTEVADSNVAPILAAISSPVSIPELSNYSFDANATDANASDTLTFSLMNAPAGATINSSTGVFNWTPSEAQGVGSYTFTVRVSDGFTEDTQDVTLNVTEVADDGDNDAPVLGDLDNFVTIPELSNYSFDANATDADGDTLTFSLVNAPSGATINASTGVFNWMPSEAQGPGLYVLQVRVSDGVEQDSQFIAIGVTEVSDGNNGGGNNGDHPNNIRDCMRGGWMQFEDPSFKNQGQCIKHVIHSVLTHNKHHDNDDDQDEDEGDDD